MGRRFESPVAQFWAKVRKTETCWLWADSPKSNGYGRINLSRPKRSVLVHRFAYELLVGPIPAGLTIDHVHARGCTSKMCVNPAHLEAVPIKVNNQRRSALITHCPRGHLLAGRNLQKRNDNKRNCATCNAAASLRSYHRRMTRKRLADLPLFGGGR